MDEWIIPNDAIPDVDSALEKHDAQVERFNMFGSPKIVSISVDRSKRILTPKPHSEDLDTMDTSQLLQNFAQKK